MRRILIEQSRRKLAAKRGGSAGRVPFEEELAISLPETHSADELLSLDEAITDLAARESGGGGTRQTAILRGPVAGRGGGDVRVVTRDGEATVDLWSSLALWTDSRRGRQTPPAGLILKPVELSRRVPIPRSFRHRHAPES